MPYKKHQLIPARVQPLAVSVKVLLPNLYHWYTSNPKSRSKEVTAAGILSAYNTQIKFFNSVRKTEYRPLVINHLYYWLRSNSAERMRTPYLDELLVLASVSGFDTPQEVINNYSNWVHQSFQQSLDILEAL
jgi:hypothetical protein